MKEKRPLVSFPVHWLAALAALASVSPLAAQQTPSDPVLRDFEPSGDYVLYVDGTAATDADLYFSRRASAYLVQGPAFPSPLLLNQRGGTVESVHLMKVVPREDGSIDLLADASLSTLGRLQFDGEEVVFAYEGKEARLKPKPPLVGTRQAAELLSHSPEYGRAAASYTPDAGSIAALRDQGRPVEVKVFFGSWCSHCKRHLPHLLKVEDGLSDSEVGFVYYGLPRPPAAWVDAEVKRMGVREVPTGIVYVDGREVGRIVKSAWLKPEEALRDIVAKAGGKSGR